jgi:hypothetical protein
VNHIPEKMNHEPHIYGPDVDTRQGAAVYTPAALAVYDLAGIDIPNLHTYL